MKQLSPKSLLLSATALLSALPLLSGTWHAARFGTSAGYSAALTRFVDVAETAGLDYTFHLGKRPLTILGTIGNGCAFLDFNNDDRLDILLVGQPLALFQGDGKGHFTDVTQARGLAGLKGHFLGCAVGDWDNDGWDDLYISGWHTGLLLKNEKGEKFADITRTAGLAPQPWGSSCGFADLNNDGWLDLYVAGYVEFGPGTKPQNCEFTVKDDLLFSACGPSAYKTTRGTLYLNQAGRGFRDVTRAWGANATPGHGLAVAFADFDDSGRVSFAVANDDRPGDLFQNRGDGRLKNIAEASGTAYEPSGDVHGGMSADWGDYDNDGKLDLFVATFREEIKSLYRNEGGGVFTDLSDLAGVATPAWPYVAFGAKLFDADNDGWLDLLIANGHIKDYVEFFEDSQLRQPSLFLHNQGGRPVRFADGTASAGKDLQRRLVGRGLAVGDYDNDGRVDALIVNSEGKPLLLHNESTVPRQGWAGFRLVGAGPKMNRNAYNATIRVRFADGRELLRPCHPGGSYLSSSDARVHFGLGGGAPATLPRVTVRWPGGQTETWENVPTGRYLTLRPGHRPH